MNLIFTLFQVWILFSVFCGSWGKFPSLQLLNAAPCSPAGCRLCFCCSRLSRKWTVGLWKCFHWQQPPPAAANAADQTNDSERKQQRSRIWNTELSSTGRRRGCVSCTDNSLHIFKMLHFFASVLPNDQNLDIKFTRVWNEQTAVQFGRQTKLLCFFFLFSQSTLISRSISHTSSHVICCKSKNIAPRRLQWQIYERLITDSLSATLGAI